jgi:glycosyltransferase involved in cell wall biosynthesis
MRVLLITPVGSKHSNEHAVRGSGVYAENLIKSLKQYFPDNNYTVLSPREKMIQNPDIIHITFFEPFFLTLPLQKKYPTVVTVHDLTPLLFKEHFPSGIKGNIIWRTQKALLKKMDTIVTDSMSSKKDIVSLTGVDQSKVSVIPLAANSVFTTVSTTTVNAVQKKYHLPDEFVLYVGDVTWNKNIPRLISAMEQISLPLVLVGKTFTNQNVDEKNPWNKDLVTVQNAIKNNKKIKVLGFIPTQDLPAIYAAASVFVMPSLYEGFGLPILEAMSCNCAVITSDRGSLKEVGGDAVFTVNPESIDSIKEGILKVIHDNTLRKNLIQKGKERIKDFTWKKTTEKTVEVYEKIYNKR